MDICSIDDCSGKAEVRGWCSKHYSRFKRYGDPHALKGSAHGLLAIERVMLYSVPNPDTGCREMKRNIRSHGYATVSEGGGKSLYAHRVSYEFHNGPIPDGMVVCHRCDNPPCVEPSHLFLGTKADNTHDMMRKGRYVGNGFARRTHCKNGHEFTSENTGTDSEGYRKCLTCYRAHARKYERIRKLRRAA